MIATEDQAKERAARAYEDATGTPTGLSEAGLAILTLLVGELRKGRFKPDHPYTFCGYKEAHEVIGLALRGAHWGNSLRQQGLADLAAWLNVNRLPAITGLIVGEEEPRHPGSGYFEINGMPDDSLDWWREQIRASITFDWSSWVPDTEPVLAKDFAAESRSYLEGANAQVTREIKVRCDALRKRAKEYFRDPDGFLRCRICHWHKPKHGMISGDIVELHHIDPLSQSPDEGRLITVADVGNSLLPLCPNCHRMIHSRTGGRQFREEELRAILSMIPQGEAYAMG